MTRANADLSLWPATTKIESYRCAAIGQEIADTAAIALVLVPQYPWDDGIRRNNQGGSCFVGLDEINNVLIGNNRVALERVRCRIDVCDAGDRCREDQRSEK